MTPARASRTAGGSGAATNGTAFADDRNSIDGEVLIKLSGGQIRQVVRAASGAGNLNYLMSGLTGVREALAATSGARADSRLSGSLLAGLLVLSSLPADGAYLATWRSHGCST